MNKDIGKKYALGLLNTRFYTCAEICERLSKKGVSNEEAEKIVSELMENGFLDDKRYAEYYVHDAAEIAGKGAYRIRQELIKKGIAPKIAEEALSEAEDSFKETILSYTRMKFGENIEVSYKELIRIKNHLVRRGYSWGEISDCLNELGIKASRSERY